MSEQEHMTMTCDTHGTEPWGFELMCRACHRVYRPECEGDKKSDGPFISPKWQCPETGELMCECLTVFLANGGEGSNVKICRQCFLDEVEVARAAGCDINSESMRARRAKGSHS